MSNEEQEKKVDEEVDKLYKEMLTVTIIIPVMSFIFVIILALIIIYFTGYTGV